MKISKLCAVAVVLSGIASVATAQGPASGLKAPSTVSVIASKSQRLRPGESFHFLLTFNEAPKELEGGSVSARFERVSGPAPRFKPIDEEDHAIWTSVPVHDGQKIYNLSQNIPPLAAPGTWKLVEVSISRRRQKTYSVPDVSFDIPELRPMVVHINSPKSVEAGHPYVATVTLDEYSKDIETNCIIHLYFHAHTADSTKRAMDLGDIKLIPGQLSYKLSYPLDSEVPSGPWEGDATIRATLGDDRWTCQYPPLGGDLGFSFKVEQNKNIVFPTSVVVTVNPQQSELLVAEADRLKAKAQHLRQQLSTDDVFADRFLLQNSLQEALNDLDRTEKSFNEKGKESPSRPVTVFFDDIRRSYRDALKIVIDSSAQISQTGPRFVGVRVTMQGPARSLNAASEAVLASILRNASAYDVVASTKVLTFTLHVYSDPQGATISYKIQGDDEYQPVDHGTDWQIENIPRAFYCVRLQMQGCEEKETPFDAMKNQDPSVHVMLKCKRGRP